jgi:hypothetical protein
MICEIIGADWPAILQQYLDHRIRLVDAVAELVAVFDRVRLISIEILYLITKAPGRAPASPKAGWFRKRLLPHAGAVPHNAASPIKFQTRQNILLHTII